MEDYGRYNYEEENNQNMNGEARMNYQPSPGRKPEKKNKGKWAKRIGAVALSAVLFGGIAGGTFVGVVYASGNGEQFSSTQNSQTGKIDNNKTKLQTTSTTGNGTTENQSLDVSDIVEGTMPSIVSITNKSVQEVQSYFDMFGRGGGMQQEVESCGSGIIIGQNDNELLIATNNHVVADADTISVGFIDNQAYEASVKGTDADNDLAVIAVKLSDISDDTMKQIKVASIGDSDSLKVGEQVVAIGNALGYGQSVTTGIVSAVDRQVGGSEAENGFIQTDAAINPGNSGGALLNMKGEVIGINSAKLASTEVEGMGYAIPLSTASPIIENLMNRTTREKVSEEQAAAIGISGENVDSSISQAYGIPQGVLVAEVTPGGAAEQAGVIAGSVITKFDGTSVSTIEELKSLLTYYAAGETVDLVVKIADNGEYVEKTISITLGKAQNVTAGNENQQGNLQEGAILR